MHIVHFSVVILTIASSSGAMSESDIDTGKMKSLASSEELDCMGSVRLSTLLKTPGMLPGLDQRQYLSNEETTNVVSETLALPREFFPLIFDVTGTNNSIYATSICLSDGTFFLWKKTADVEVLAMAPLKGTPHRRSDARSVKVWLCATSDKAASEWLQRPKDGALLDWLQDNIKKHTGANVRFSEEDREKNGVKNIQGILNAYGRSRSVTVRVGQRLLAIEVVLNYEELISLITRHSQVLEPKKLPKRPVPFPSNWPPSEKHTLGD
jgi:hypothetical protein